MRTSKVSRLLLTMFIFQQQEKNVMVKTAKQEGKLFENPKRKKNKAVVRYHDPKLCTDK